MKDINKKIVWVILCLLLFTVLSPIIEAIEKNNIENHRNATVNLKHLNYNLKGDILYVGGSGSGNYSSIKAAIDNASSGDTVFVFNHSSPYFENIIINESINFEGENKESTVINGGWEGDVVNISADHVKITGFTIRYSGSYNAGIKIHTSYNVIEDNILLRNSDGICIKSSHDNIITGNIIASALLILLNYTDSGGMPFPEKACWNWIGIVI